MMPYNETGSLFQSFFLVYLLLPLFVSLYSFTISLIQITKPSKKAVSSVILCFVIVFYLYSFMLFESSINGVPIFIEGSMLVKIPLYLMIILALVLTLLTIGDHILLLRYKKTHLSMNSLKESLDELPTGICFYDENGAVLLTNRVINEDSVQFFGYPLLNGLDFWNGLRKEDINQEENQKKEEEVIVRLPEGGEKTSEDTYIHRRTRISMKSSAVTSQKNMTYLRNTEPRKSSLRN